MSTDILINSRSYEVRLALVENGILTEFHMQRPMEKGLKGNIYRGKVVRVLVFAKGPKEAEAKAAGADFVGADDLVEKINGGWLEFDKAIATPDMMATVSKVAIASASN